MLTHHDARQYDVAASEAATHFRGKVGAMVANGAASAENLIHHVAENVPRDFLPLGEQLSFRVEPAKKPVPKPAAAAPAQGRTLLDEIVEEGEQQQAQGSSLIMQIATASEARVSNYALGQLVGKIGSARNLKAYLDSLVEGLPWEQDLAAHILNEHYRRDRGSAKDPGIARMRHLIRVVKGTARAALSDSYRRLDDRPLLDAFIRGCQKIGARPYEGTVTGQRVALKATLVDENGLPMIFEPVPNEVMILLVQWGNSDFGAAAHTCTLGFLRLWCTNKAMTEDGLRTVHNGSRLMPDIEYMQATIDADTKAEALVLEDTVVSLLGPKKVGALMAAIKSANDKQIDWKDLKTQLEKALLKGELRDVEAAFNGNNDLELPPGKTVWRASNALSWVCGKIEDPDRRLQMERLAGKIAMGQKITEGDRVQS